MNREPWFAARRQIAAKATARPWRWRDGGATEGWALPDQKIHYRLLDATGRAALNHAQTWPIRDAEADLVVSAVNDYDLLLDIADAAEAFRCADRDEAALADVGELDDDTAMRTYRAKRELFDALTRAENSQARPE